MQVEAPLVCPQCGADIPRIEESGLITCTYCSSTLYVDLSKAIQHFYYPVQISPDLLKGFLTRWLYSHELNRMPEIVQSTLVYIPFWRVIDGRRLIFLPAASLQGQGLDEMGMPSGDYKRFDPSLSDRHTFVQPDIFLESILSASQAGSKQDQTPPEAFLIHVPLFKVAYRYEKREYEVMIEAVEGKVMADATPPLPQLRMDRYFSAAMLSSLSVFVAEFYFIHGLWRPLAVSIATAIPLHFLLNHLLLKRGW